MTVNSYFAFITWELNLFYNTSICVQNIHKRHSIAHPWGRVGARYLYLYLYLYLGTDFAVPVPVPVPASREQEVPCTCTCTCR